MTTPRCVLVGRTRRSDGMAEPAVEDCRAVRELWMVLLAQLQHVGRVCMRPEAMRHLKHLGVRRPDLLASGLAAEFDKSTLIALKCCCAPSALDVFLHARPPTGHDELHRCFEELGHMYQRLLDALEPPIGSHRRSWLESRTRVHLSRAESLRRAT